MVKFRLDKGCSNDSGSAEVEGGSDASEIAQVVGARA